MKTTLRLKTFLTVGGVVLGALALTVAVFLRFLREEKLSAVFEGNVASARVVRDRLDADLAVWNATLAPRGGAGLRESFAAVPELLALQVSRTGAPAASASDPTRIAAAGIERRELDAAVDAATKQAVGGSLPHARSWATASGAPLLVVVGRAGGAAYAAALDLESLSDGAAARGLSVEVLPARADAAAVSPVARTVRTYLRSGVSEGAFRSREGGDDQLASFVAGRGGGYAVVARRPYSAVTAAQRRFLGQAALLAALVAAVSLGASGYFARRLSKPIERLSAAAERVAEGDLTAGVEIEGDDELGALAGRFNRMTERLRYFDGLNIEKIANQNREIQAIVTSTADGIVVLDTAGRAAVANPAARRLLGLADGRPLDEMPEKLSRLLAAHEKSSVISWTPDGEKAPLWLSVLRADYIDAAGRALGQVVAVRDVTAEKQLEKTRDEYYSLLTHDLRSPLASVKSAIDYMKEFAPQAPAAGDLDLVAMVDRSVDDMLRMINQVLDLGKAEAGKLTLNPRPVPARALFERAVETLKALAAEKGVLVEIDAPPGLRVLADTDYAFRAVMNLVSNAIKFTDKGGRVLLTAVPDAPGFVRCSVRDSGLGIPPEDLPRLFNKYEQARNTRNIGTGLGLSLAKAVVEAHGGTIRVDSELGRGSVFSFTLRSADKA